MNKEIQLKKFGAVIKHRREALDYTIRELARISGLSAALITKLENGKMKNFPKMLTIKHLSVALKFENELFELADILTDAVVSKVDNENKAFEEDLRELLATRTTLDNKNIEQIIYFVLGLEKLQKIKNLE